VGIADEDLGLDTARPVVAALSSVLRWLIVGFRRMPAFCMANALQRPELAPVILALARDGEWTIPADPPFGGVEPTLAFHWVTTPAPKLGFPLPSGQEPVRDQELVRVDDVFFRSRNEPLWRHYPVFLKGSTDVLQRLNVNVRVEAMRQDDLQGLCHIGKNTIDIRV